MLKSVAITCLLSLSALPLWAQDSDLEYINFPLNSSVVVDGFQGLEMLAAVMASHKALDLEVVGHTDSLGTVEYNKRLSQRRAESVRAYLVSKGAAEGQIKILGDGISRSFDNANREGRFQNRRVDLILYETVNGRRTKVTYDRLLALFFGSKPGNMAVLKELTGDDGDAHKEIMEKLTDLDKKITEMGENLQKRIGELERSQGKYVTKDELPQAVSHQMQVGKYTGVSIGAGLDDDDDFTGQIRGLYFRPISDDFALQVQGEANYYDRHEDGQADVAFVYQTGHFKMAAAGSYKWASIEGLDTARLAQGAILADWHFETGKIGLFGTFPIADGDVLASIPLTGAFVNEIYASVPTQLGVDFGVSIGDRADLGGFVSSLDTEQSSADLSAGLNLQLNIKEKLNWYLEAQMNEGLLAGNDDVYRYMTGLRLGSWTKARYNVSDHITPVSIPQVRYEILSRVVRNGNTAPIANAGSSRTNVAAGTVTLDGSASSDPEGDPLTYQWTQTNGPTVELTNGNQAVATFTGVAGEAYTFLLTVRDNFGDSGTGVVSISMEAAPIPDPVIVNFRAAPATIDEGQFSTLIWTTENGESITLSGVGEVAPAGNLLVSPEVTTEYTLTVTNPSGTVSQTVTVTVNEPPPIPMPVIEFFTAVPDTIMRGELTTLSWSTTYGEIVEIGGFGKVNASGSIILSPDETTTYNITATNVSGAVTQNVTVTVLQPPPIPEPIIGFLSAAPSTIFEGEFTTLSWSTQYADSVTISGIGSVQNAGSLLLSPDATTTYTLTATNATGSATSTVTVTVNPLPPPNNDPIAEAGNQQNVFTGTTVTLNGSASVDPDGDPLTYQWTQIAGEPVTLSGADTATPSFVAVKGLYSFRLTVTDGRGGIDSDNVDVFVINFKR